MTPRDYIPRAIEEYAFDESLTGRHMVFLAGPRQVGKTMLARKWLEKNGCPSLYYNWDDIATRRSYRNDSRFFESSARSLGIRDPWIVFDEIHKRTRWRDILKGAYDIFGKDFRFLVTGSARLDLFRRSGDSLVGRYNLFHMMPLNIREVTGLKCSPCFLRENETWRLIRDFERQVSLPLPREVEETYMSLREYGPFPEPFLRQNERFSRKWHQDYLSLVVRQDLKDVSRVAELDKVEHLLQLFPDRITAPLSMANLARELEAAHTTVKSWLEQLKRLYVLFSIDPWTQKISRGLKKEKKWFFLDWHYAPVGSARLENMVATYLYRACLCLSDMGYGCYRLHYIRTLDKREIDFLVTVDHRPVMAMEVKSGDLHPASSLKTRQKWFPDSPTLGIQVVDRRGILQKHPENTWIVSVERFLSLLE
ncbi:MAG: ATP-binding protein [Deltaproteobacteria bacterium]|nr:ATP-binding protein [Deltaproteobacteria bacterium]